MLSRMRIGGERQAELGRHLAAHHRDAAEQVAALVGVDQRHQAVADLQLERVERQQGGDVLGLRRAGGDGGRGLLRGLLLVLLADAALQQRRDQRG